MSAPLRTLVACLLALLGPVLVIVPLQWLHPDHAPPAPAHEPRRIALERGGERRAAHRPPPSPSPPAPPLPEIVPELPSSAVPPLRLPRVDVALALPTVASVVAAVAPRDFDEQRAPSSPRSSDASEDDGRPAVADGPVHEDGVDQPPRPLPGNLPPSYPPAERRGGRGGAVQVRIVIDERGLVSDVRELSREGSEAFTRAVRDAVGRWRFEPARDGGRPIAVYALQTFRFDLTDR